MRDFTKDELEQVEAVRNILAQVGYDGIAEDLTNILAMFWERV